MIPTLIEIKQNRPGFDRFIGSWAIPGKRNIVIDVGPSNSIPGLTESLMRMNLDRVDWVLLTHIHIDHAGGVARFLEHFPMARVVCHAKATGHLIDPSKLWEGTRKALGDLSDTYGPIRPVKQDKLVPHTEAAVKGLDIIETPGHAQHHLSFIYDRHLFAGEAGGIYFTAGNEEYLRPATPPVFLLNEFLGSMDRLLEKEEMPICYAHFGSAQSSRLMLKRHAEQLLLWEKVIRGELLKGESHLPERCIEEVLARDPELRAFERLRPEDQERERFFMNNSVKGYLGYLSSRPLS